MTAAPAVANADTVTVQCALFNGPCVLTVALRFRLRTAEAEGTC